MTTVLETRRTPELNDAEASDVLRYWLGSMRHQEALAARPKARRQDTGGSAVVASSIPNLVDPVPGQNYAKLDWVGREAFVAAQRGQVELDMDPESRAFFEDWLSGAYRRGEDDEKQRVGHLLSFPTLLLPKGDLCGLLRSPVDVGWLAAGPGSFAVPSYKQRAAGNFPEAPSRWRLTHAQSDDEGALPFFVDSKLLIEVLRIDAERLDAFFVALRKKRVVRPRAMVDALAKLVSAQYEDDVSELGPVALPAAAKLERRSERALADLQVSLSRRLAQMRSRIRVYPIALVVNSDQSRATAHAQRDIEAALEQIADKALARPTPLSRYLRGQVVTEVQAPNAQERCLGRYAESGLTAHQLLALELSQGARLSAIQGPPGTGKTTLILNRVADALVRKVTPLLSGYAMSDAILVVTSTNNAAVDNVTTPLGNALGGEGLPLALRVGSREVTERVTSADLERCIAWLERHKQASTADELASRLASFREQHAALATLPAATTEEDSRVRERLGFELFQAAESLRAAWAVANRINLLNVLTLALRATRGSRSIKRLLEAPGAGSAWLRRLFPCWGSTLLSLGNVFPAEAGCIEHVIIDEAGQCHPGYAVSALLRAKSALVIGDVHQLEPVIGLSREDELRILRSLRLGIATERLEPYRTHDEAFTSAQSLADRAVEVRPTLIDHFRCQPEIAAICERLCAYGLVTRTAPSSRALSVPELAAPVLFLPLSGEQQRHAGSWVNPSEALEVVRWVQYLIACGIPPDEVGVITPFRGQLDLLWRELAHARVPLAQQGRPAEQDNLDLFGAPSGGLALGTVHRFQGGERSIILFSTTVTRPTSLRFIDERVNLINVAASRAREHLITVGHEATLRAGRYTQALLCDARRLQ